MATIDQIVNVQITRETRTPSRVGFGTPLIMGWTDAFPEVARAFTDPADLLDLAGIEATDPLYKAAVMLMSQNPRPPRFIVGRRESTAPTQAVAIKPESTTEGATVGITIGGERAEYTVEEGDTLSDVVTGLTGAINALSVDVTATADTGDDVVDVASDAAGSFFAYENPVGCHIEADETPSVAVADDLTAIRQSNDDWYMVLHPQSSSKAQTLAIAAAIEGITKMFAANTADFDALDTEDATDVLSELKALGYDRTFPLWHQELGSGAAAGWAGGLLPREAGRVTWAHKDINGLRVTPRFIGGRDVFQVEAKNGNYFTETAGLRLTFNGVTVSGEYVDIMRGTDQLERRIKERVLGVLANAAKVDFSDDGIESIVSQVEAELAEGETPKQGVRFLQPGSSEVTAPSESDVSSADKAARTLRDVEFVSRYAGAIQKVEIRGRISL